VEQLNKSPQRKLHRLPIELYSLTEYEFFFTVCARHQGSPFTTPALAHEVIKSLLWTRAHYKWQLFCYCLMPDHLHFVCRLTERDARIFNAGARGAQVEGILDHLGRFKSFTTNTSWKHGFTGKLWQQSSHDRVLDMERPFEDVVLYTLRNPVRKGWVAEWEDWPHSAIVDQWW
jgi:REP element-mobilizing transposase RayT